MRDRLSIFSAGWEIRHVFDEKSPLHAIAPDTASFKQLRFFLMVAAHDATFGQDVSDLHVFTGADIAFSAR